MGKVKFIKKIIAAKPIVLVFAIAVLMSLIGICLLFLLLWLTSGSEIIKYAFYPSVASFLSFVGLLLVYAYLFKFRGTLLHYAVFSRREKLVKWLVANGADTNASTKTGWTVLHEAAGSGNKIIVENLLSAGALINRKDKTGQTPLHIAVLTGNGDIAEILIANGADVNLRNNNGRTPLDIATSLNRMEVIRVLRKHMGNDGGNGAVEKVPYSR
jgi:ankyrin repeat protein